MSVTAFQSFLEITRRVPGLGAGRILVLGLADTEPLGHARAAGLDAWAMTTSPGAASAAESSLPGGLRFESPATTLPYDDGQFELVVVLAAALEDATHLERTTLLREARRISRGRILLSMEDRDTATSWETACTTAGLRRAPLTLSLAPMDAETDSGGTHHLLWDAAHVDADAASPPTPGAQDPLAWLLNHRMPPPPEIGFVHAESPGQISVIVPLYNGLAFVERAIRSVWEQTLPPGRIELIVIDDGSADGGPGRVEELRKQSPVPMKVLAHPEHQNLGVSATRNLGFRHASGEFIALLDADDRFLPRRLQASVEYLEDHPECLALCALGYNVNEQGDPVVGYTGTREVGNYRDYSPDLEPPYTFEQLWQAYPVANSTITFRRRALAITGGYPEQMAHQAEDWLLMLKLSLHSPVAWLDEHLIQYTHHDESYTARYQANRLDHGCRIEVFHLLTYWMLQCPETRNQGIQFYRREYPLVMAGRPQPDLRDLPGILKRAATRGLRMGPIRSARMLRNTIGQNRSRPGRGGDA